MTERITARVHEVVLAMAPTAAPDIPWGSARLREDLGFESVRLIELTMVLEQSFSLAPMPPEDLAGVRRVDDVVALITRQLALPAPADQRGPTS